MKYFRVKYLSNHELLQGTIYALNYIIYIDLKLHLLYFLWPENPGLSLHGYY